MPDLLAFTLDIASDNCGIAGVTSIGDIATRSITDHISTGVCR